MLNRDDVHVFWCAGQGMLSLRQQNTEALLDFLISAARLTARLSDVEETVLSQGWCTSLTLPDDMTRFHQVLTILSVTWLTRSACALWVTDCVPCILSERGGIKEASPCPFGFWWWMSKGWSQSVSFTGWVSALMFLQCFGVTRRASSL